MVFQHYALFPHMNVAQNIAFPLRMAKWDRANTDERVSELLDLVGLAGLEKRSPRQLSGGQQQRVALARALAARSPVVLMDEPLGALDRKLREELQEEFRRIHRETRTTFVYVTHDQGEALSLSDRIAVMRDGRVEQIGTPEDLYEHPQTAFVAGFFGEANFLEARVTAFENEAISATTSHGKVLRIARVDGRRIGETLFLAIRPERLDVLDPGAANGTANIFSGTVIDRSYGGATVRLHIESAEAGRDLLASLPAHRAHALAPGASVRVAWRPGDERVVQP